MPSSPEKQTAEVTSLSPGSPGGQTLVGTVTVARVSGITGTHAAANGDYHQLFIDTVNEIWALDGLRVDDVDGYTLWRVISTDTWYLMLGSSSTLCQGGFGAAPDDPWDESSWAAGPQGDAETATIVVTEALGTPVARSINGPLDTNQESPGSPPVQTAEATSLSPGSPPVQTAEATSLSPGSPPVQTAEATSLSPGSPPVQTAEATSLSPGSPPVQTAEATSLSPGSPPKQSAEVTSLSPGSPGGVEAEV